MKKKKILKYTISIATAVAIIIGAAIIISVLSEKRQHNLAVENNITNTKNNIDDFHLLESPQNTEQCADTVQSLIITQEEFGEVSLIKSSTSAYNLALMAGVPYEMVEEVSCYEDDMYIYIFYEDGSPAGMFAAYLNNSEISPPLETETKKLSEQEAMDLATSVLEKYSGSYSEETKARYKVESWHAEDGDVNVYPTWRLIFTEYTLSGIRRNVLTVCIDTYGHVSEVAFGIRSELSDEQLDAIDAIDSDQAISLAVAKLEKEGIEIELNRFTIETELYDFKASLFWDITISEKSDIAGEFPLGYCITLNATTGESMDVSQSQG